MKKLSEKLDGFPHLEKQRKAIVKLEEELALWKDYKDNQRHLIDQALAKSKIYGGISLALKTAKVRIRELGFDRLAEDRQLYNVLKISTKVDEGLALIDLFWPPESWADGMQESEVETIIHTLKVSLSEYHQVLGGAM